MLPVETTAARPTGTGGGNLSSGVISSSRSEEHTSELQSQSNLVCRLLLEKKKKSIHIAPRTMLQQRAGRFPLEYLRRTECRLTTCFHPARPDLGGHLPRS